MTSDGERLAQIDRDLEALGKSAAELDALRARVPKGTALDEVDRILAELANGSNGAAPRLAPAPAVPTGARVIAGKKQDAKRREEPRPSEPVVEGRRTEELIDVEALRVDQPPPAPRSHIPGRKLPSAPPPPSKRPSGAMPVIPGTGGIPRSVAPPAPPAAPPPESVSVKVALPAPPSAEADMEVGDEELYESPRKSAPGTADALASRGSLSVDDLFGGVEDPFASDARAGADDSLADLIGSAPVASEGLGPLNLSDELEADMTAVYSGDEMRALGSIPPPASAEDLDAELDAFTASQRPPPRPSQRPLRAEEFGPDPFADEPAVGASAADESEGAEGGDFELLIDDDALMDGEEDVVASPPVAAGAQPGDSELDFPDEVRTQLEGLPPVEEPPPEPEDEQPKKKGFFRKMFGK